MEPGSKACQVETGPLTVSFITLLPWALAWLLSLLHLYEVPGFCVDNKGQAAVITLDAAAALPGDCLDPSAGHSALCLCPLGGFSLSSRALRPERETGAGLCPQG